MQVPPTELSYRKPFKDSTITKGEQQLPKVPQLNLTKLTQLKNEPTSSDTISQLRNELIESKIDLTIPGAFHYVTRAFEKIKDQEAIALIKRVRKQQMRVKEYQRMQKWVSNKNTPKVKDALRFSPKKLNANSSAGKSPNSTYRT